jgi:hypothetical protein
MLDYKCWFVSDGKNSRIDVSALSPKHAAKDFVKHHWCNRKNKRIENPWEHSYPVVVEDFTGIVSTWSISIEPSFCCQSFTKIKRK